MWRDEAGQLAEKSRECRDDRLRLCVPGSLGAAERGGLHLGLARAARNLELKMKPGSCCVPGPELTAPPPRPEQSWAE